MKLHTEIYMDFFGYGTEDFVPSEISGNRAVDIHHINSRGMGGSNKKDVIENLMALTREEHEKYGDKKQHMDMLQNIHNQFMEKHGK
jgi:hypothetical protein